MTNLEHANTLRGNRLRVAMRHRVSRAELARLLGVSKQRVAAWQSGTAKPTGIQLAAIALITGVTVGYLNGISHLTYNEEALSRLI